MLIYKEELPMDTLDFRTYDLPYETLEEAETRPFTKSSQFELALTLDEC